MTLAAPKLSRLGLLLLSLGLFACKPDGATNAPAAPDAEASLEGRPVVDNPEAKPGDVTTCPYSGRKFVVEADSPRFAYEGRDYVFCSEKARDAVAAEPAKYLGGAAPAPAAAE